MKRIFGVFLAFIASCFFVFSSSSLGVNAATADVVSPKQSLRTVEEVDNDKKLFFNIGESVGGINEERIMNAQDGSVSLIRDGQTANKTGVQITILAPYEHATTGRKIVGEAEFILGRIGTWGYYRRVIGDVLTIEGTWVNSEDDQYYITIEKTKLTVLEDGSLAVEKYQEDLRSQYIQNIYAEYPYERYVGASKEAYDRYIAAIEAGDPTDAEDLYQEAKAGIAQLDYLQMVSGASVRLHGENKGLRFMAELGNSYDENATYYMMIVPKYYLVGFGITDDYYTKLDEALKANGYDDIRIATMQAKPFQFSEEEVAQSGGKLQANCWYVQGSITNVLSENMEEDFFAIAYKIVDGAYYYAHFKEGDNERSLRAVARCAYADGEENKGKYTEEEMQILKDYAGITE